MADTDGDEQTQPNVAAESAGDDSLMGVSPEGEMDINEALRRVLKAAIVADGLVRGLREAAKALDKRKAHLCILATNCQEPLYIKLVEALCSEHNIPLLKVDDNKKLGEWSGLCKIDQKGNARKIVGCNCVVITAWGEENEGHFFLKDYIKKNKK